MKNLIILLMASLSISLHAQYTEVPVKVDGVDQVKVNLNGTWKFNPEPPAGYMKTTNASDAWKDIEVPGEWVMQGFNVKPATRAAYYRSFIVPENWKKNYRIFLRCDAVFSDAIIWINGHKAGSHLGGMTAFEFDVTNLINPGKENDIILGVMSESIADTLMSGSQYAAHPLGGILRKIYLYAVPDTHLGNLFVTTDFDDDYKDAVLNIKNTIFNASGGKNSVQLNIRLTAPDGSKVNLQDATKNILFKKDESYKNEELNFNISTPLKWDAEHPNLYTLTLTLSSDEKSETITKKIGFREIEIAGNKVFINGKPVKLRGVNRHETHPLLGRSLNKELWLKDAELFKAANVNYIRTSHYPPAEEFIAICDSSGLFVELENPLCWVGHGANPKWQNSAVHNPEFFDYFKQVSNESIGLLGNHPSIIIWSMANESAWGPNWAKLLEFYNKKDPTRPKTFHDQAYGGYNNFGSTSMPIANIHYPGLEGPAVADTFSRPLLFGEYSHLNCYNREEIATDPGVRDSWGKGIKKIAPEMYLSRGCLGGAIWSGIDDIFYLPEGKAVGYGEWGPIDGWRRKKPEYYHMKKAYSPVVIHNTNIKTPPKGEPVKLQIENRFDFTDLSECRIEWEIGDETGNEKMNLTPGNSGILKIYPKTNPEGKRLKIRTYSPLGYLVDETTVSIGNIKRDDYLFKTIEPGTFKLDSTAKNFIVKNNRSTWTFSKQTGKLSQADIDGEQILIGNTELMILPLHTGACATEHSLHIPFLNDKCKDRKLQSITATQKQDTVSVNISVSYKEADGTISYLFIKNEPVKINYDFISKIKINPRQWGLVLDIDNTYRNLEWSREGIWTEYPEDHIGRTQGKAVPFESGKYHKQPFGKKPLNKWYHDENKLGSNDFRSTKDNIYWTTLTNDEGYGIVITGNGKTSTRAWQQGNDINLLITGFSTGGGDLFFSGYYKDERKPLKPGDSFGGEILLKFIEK